MNFDLIKPSISVFWKFNLQIWPILFLKIRWGAKSLWKYQSLSPIPLSSQYFRIYCTVLNPRTVVPSYSWYLSHWWWIKKVKQTFLLRFTTFCFSCKIFLRGNHLNMFWWMLSNLKVFFFLTVRWCRDTS